jgi:hypothetical protein
MPTEETMAELATAARGVPDGPGGPDWSLAVLLDAWHYVPNLPNMINDDEYCYICPVQCGTCRNWEFVGFGESTTCEVCDPDHLHEPELESPGMTSQVLYPIHLRGSTEQAAAALRDLPLALIIDDPNGQPGDAWLVLTEGGQEMTWHVLAGYLALNILPPAQLALSIRNDAPPEISNDVRRRVLAMCHTAAVEGQLMIHRKDALLIEAERIWRESK